MSIQSDIQEWRERHFLRCLEGIISHNRIRFADVENDGTSLIMAPMKRIPKFGLEFGAEYRAVVNMTRHNEPRIEFRLELHIQTSGHAIPHAVHMEEINRRRSGTPWTPKQLRNLASGTLLALEGDTESRKSFVQAQSNELQTIVWFLDQIKNMDDVFGEYLRVQFR